MDTSEDSFTGRFSVYDHSVFLSMLAISLVIGLYHGLRKKEGTIRDYLLANRSLQTFPVSMSLISSITSGVALLGLPTEVYKYGSQWLFEILSYTLGALVNIYIFLPIFYKLELLSLYEYLEIRFNKTVRLLSSFLYTIEYFLYSAIVVYGPALVINQGIDILFTAYSLTIICILYTVMGGLKAVVWTDTFQCIFMILSSFVILIAGVVKVGGVQEVYKLAQKGDRIELFNMNPDPQERLTFWTVSISSTFFFVAYTGTNPSVIQRLSALPSYGKAKVALMSTTLGTAYFCLVGVLLGLTIYARYESCDIISAKIVERDDQILPYFVLDVARHLTGVPGLFSAGLTCAALSTLSTTLNTLSGIIYKDFVSPFLPVNLPENKKGLIIKGIIFCFGLSCILLLGMVENVDTLFSLTYVLSGITLGASFSLFLMASLCPTITALGASVGGFTSLSCMLALSLGNLSAVSHGYVSHPTKPLLSDGCIKNLTASTPRPPHLIEEEYNSILMEILRISVFHYTLIGTIIGVSVGLIVSHLTGPLKLGDVHPSLLSHVIHRFLPKKNYQPLTLRIVDVTS